MSAAESAQVTDEKKQLQAEAEVYAADKSRYVVCGSMFTCFSQKCAESSPAIVHTPAHGQTIALSEGSSPFI